MQARLPQANTAWGMCHAFCKTCLHPQARGKECSRRSQPAACSASRRCLEGPAARWRAVTGTCACSAPTTRSAASATCTSRPRPSAAPAFCSASASAAAAAMSWAPLRAPGAAAERSLPSTMQGQHRTCLISAPPEHSERPARSSATISQVHCGVSGGRHLRDGAVAFFWTLDCVCRRRRQAGSTLSAEELQRSQSGLQDNLMVPSLLSRVLSPANYAYQVIEWTPLCGCI